MPEMRNGPSAGRPAWHSVSVTVLGRPPGGGAGVLHTTRIEGATPGREPRAGAVPAPAKKFPALPPPRGQRGDPGPRARRQRPGAALETRDALARTEALVSPVKVRRQPDTFCLSLAMRISRSVPLLSGGTAKSWVNRRSSCWRLSRRRASAWCLRARVPGRLQVWLIPIRAARTAPEPVPLPGPWPWRGARRRIPARSAGARSPRSSSAAGRRPGGAPLP